MRKRYSGEVIGEPAVQHQEYRTTADIVPVEELQNVAMGKTIQNRHLKMHSVSLNQIEREVCAELALERDAELQVCLIHITTVIPHS